MLELVAEPRGEATPMRPVVAPAGTVAVIFVAELSVNAAAAPLKVTDVAPVKFVPLIVTVAPTRPFGGEKFAITGPAVNAAALVAVPAGVCTWMVPVDTPAGTTAAICVLEFTVKEAPLSLNFVEEASRRFVPVIVTVTPGEPLAGEKDVIAGSGLKFGLPAEPAGVVTVILPVVAAVGTLAVIWVAESIRKVAPAPSKLTAVAPRKLLPVRRTLVPAVPLAGESAAILGNGLKGKPLVRVPPAFVTAIPPIVASAGTFAVI